MDRKDYGCVISNNPSKFQVRLDSGSTVTVTQKLVMIPKHGTFGSNERVMLTMSGGTDNVVSLSKGCYRNPAETVCENSLNESSGDKNSAERVHESLNEGSGDKKSTGTVHEDTRGTGSGEKTLQGQP